MFFRMFFREHLPLYTILVSLILLTACHRDNVVIDSSFTAILRISGISYSENGILVPIFENNPAHTFDHNTDQESRAFYESVDTSLTFKMYPQKKIHPEWGDISAIDWRITTIKVISLEDYDEIHPKGSTLNDLLQIQFCYKSKYITIPLKQFEYGSLMLSDYYRFDPTHRNILLTYIQNQSAPSNIRITLEDAFGRTFSTQDTPL